MDNIAFLENEDFTADGKLVLPETVIVLIYANWCPPCEAFKPTFFELASHTDARVACIELDGHLPGQKELADRIHAVFPDLQGTPTVCVYVGGQVAGVFDGERDLESLIAFSRQYTK